MSLAAVLAAIVFALPLLLWLLSKLTIAESDFDVAVAGCHCHCT
jgi:hypothetical protein